MRLKCWAHVLLATLLVIFGGSLVSAAQEISIDFIRDINFGTILGAPRTYSTGQPGIINFTANVPIDVEFYATPLAYAEKDYDSLPNPELDVVYRINPMPGGQLSLRPGYPQVVRIQPKGNGKHHFNFHGTIEIHDIHLQPAGPYQGDIIVTISAANGGG